MFKGKNKVMVRGDGKQTRGYVHVDDIVKGLVMARDWKRGEYWMGSGKSLSVLDLAKGKEIEFVSAIKEPGEVDVPNTTPNWEPKINPLEYIK